jgi:hypothetical protein
LHRSSPNTKDAERQEALELRAALPSSARCPGAALWRTQGRRAHRPKGGPSQRDWIELRCAAQRKAVTRLGKWRCDGRRPRPRPLLPVWRGVTRQRPSREREAGSDRWDPGAFRVAPPALWRPESLWTGALGPIVAERFAPRTDWQPVRANGVQPEEGPARGARCRARGPGRDEEGRPPVSPPGGWNSPCASSLDSMVPGFIVRDLLRRRPVSPRQSVTRGRRYSCCGSFFNGRGRRATRRVLTDMPLVFTAFWATGV